MTDPAADPHRLIIAAHELGHAIVWRSLGFTIDEIWVKGHHTAVRGQVWLDITRNVPWTLDHERGYYVGLASGRAAQLRWCDENGVTFNERDCATDMALYEQRRRTRLGRQVRPSDVQREAHRLVRAHWTRIVRLTPQLAARGSLSPSRV